jgi:molecular chaperone DnaK (HSP70)
LRKLWTEFILVLICDCGGGTVDITTYRIKSTFPVLEFEELAVGQGGKVGSTFIDRQFHEWLCSHFGVDFYTLEFKKKGPGSRLMKEFEAIKRDFGSNRSSQNEYRVPLVMREVRNSRFYDEDEHMVIFSRYECFGAMFFWFLTIGRDDLESFFQPSMSKIKQLLAEQIDKANAEMPWSSAVNVRLPVVSLDSYADIMLLQTIILVGGFGDSQHLHDCLSQWCAQNGGLRLICPPNPQAA